MQLRQAEALGVFDQHDRGVRHVHADLDHGRRHQNLNLIRAERRHYALFLGGLHLSEQQADVEFREDFLAQVLVHLGRVPQIELFGLLDDRIDDVSLAALFDLVADELVNLLAPVFAAHVRRNRRAARRHLVDDRDFEVAVNGHRQAARDRRSRHYKYVGVDAAPSKFGALQDAEAMLFVDHGEAQTFELHRVLNKRVRADDQVDVARGDGCLNLALLFRLQTTGKQLDAIRGVGEPAPNVAGVLLGQNLRRRHQGRLVAVLDRDDHRLNRDDRLAAAHVALQQAVHRLVAGHIIDNLFQRPLLRLGRMERQYRTYGLAHAVGDLDDLSFRLADALAPAQAQRKREPEELLEDQSPVRGRTRQVVIVDRRIVGGKMDFPQSVEARDQIAARDNLIGQRFGGVLFDPLEQMVKDRAQLTRAKIAELAVDGHATRRVDGRRLGIVVVIGQKFVLGIFDLVIAFVLVQLPLAVEDHARAALKDPVEINLVPPVSARLKFAVRGDELVHLQPPAFERNDPAHAHHHLDRRSLAVLQLRDARQIRPVFVAHRQIMQQVLDRRVAGVGLRGDGGGQPVRCLLADARQAVMMKFDEWSVESQQIIRASVLYLRALRYI